MSKKEIQDSLKIFNEKINHFSFVEEELANLVIALSKHLISMPEVTIKDSNQTQKTQEEIKLQMVTLKDFVKVYKKIPLNTVYRHCKNLLAIRPFVLFFKDQWYVHPEKLKEYYENSPRVKKLMERYAQNC